MAAYQHRRSGRRALVTAAALVVLVPLAVRGSRAAAADVAGGRVTLSTDAPTVIDTRSGVGVPPAKVSDIALPPNSVLTITMLEPAVDGQGVVHTCGTPPPASPALFVFAAGEIETGTVTTGTAATCVAFSTPVHVTAVKRGDASATPGAGNQYVPLAEDVFSSYNVPGTGEWNVPIDVAPPADATAAVIQVSALSKANPGFFLFHACNGAGPATSDLVVGSADSSRTIAYAPLSTPGEAKLCFYSQTALEFLGLDIIGYLRPTGPDPTRLPPSLGFVMKPSIMGLFPFEAPERALDTREGSGINGIVRKAEAGETVVLDLRLRAGTQSRAIALNVTATEPEAPGFITVFPCDEAQPLASNLNYEAGSTVPNQVIVRLPRNQRVCLYTKSKTHLVVDVAGTYNFARGDGAVPVAPVRLLDTRDGTGMSSPLKLAAGTTLTLQVAGRGGVPASGASAVTMNVTVTEPENAGYLTVYPCGEAQPTASNLNYVAGQTVPNAVTVGLSSAGTVCIFSQSAAHVVADLSAWYSPDQAAGYNSVRPARVLDTRVGTGAPVGKLTAGSALALQVTGDNGVPAGAVSAVVLNVTVTETDGPGFVTVYPCDEPRPTASSLNYVAKQTVANLVTVKVSALGTVCLFSQQNVHLVADVSGYVSITPTTDWSIGAIDVAT